MADNRPIGIFDSGVGGLTVLRAIQQILPYESTVYLGDLARCPYGPRAQYEVREFALEIAHLLAHENIKMLVIACNTATAAAFPDLVGRFPFPVIGVVQPGAREAARLTRNGRIGVIATDGTVASGAYTRAILECLPAAAVEERSASWLVPIIERGPIAHGSVVQTLTPTLDDLRGAGIDTLILGCTHFPLVRDIFAAGIGPDIVLLDSAVTTAEQITLELAGRGILAEGPAHHRLLVTGPAEAFAERVRAMFRSSRPIETVSLAPGCACGGRPAPLSVPLVNELV